MSHDPIVEEIHDIREKILSECGGDLGKLLERYRTAEDRDRHRVVTLEMVREQRRGAFSACAESAAATD